MTEKWVQGEVVDVKHWTETLYSVKVSAPNVEFIAGQYVAISSQNIGKRLYSIASFGKSNEQFDLIITKVEHGAMSEFLFSDVFLNFIRRFFGFSYTNLRFWGR